MSKKSIVEKVHTFSHDYNCSDLLAKSILKLCREAARRGYEAGVRDELHCSVEGGWAKAKRKALRQIIHGVKR